MKRTHFTMSNVPPQELVDAFRRQFAPTYEYTSAQGHSKLFIMEKFSFWQNSDISGTVMIDWAANGDLYVNIIVSGGKAGLFRIDLLGRESALVNKFSEFFHQFVRRTSVPPPMR